jgi:hypothetical protein
MSDKTPKDSKANAPVKIVLKESAGIPQDKAAPVTPAPAKKKSGISFLYN